MLSTCTCRAGHMTKARKERTKRSCYGLVGDIVMRWPDAATRENESTFTDALAQAQERRIDVRDIVGDVLDTHEMHAAAEAQANAYLLACMRKRCLSHCCTCHTQTY